MTWNAVTQEGMEHWRETKGSMSSMDLKPVEQAKIKCAKNLFAGLSGGKVRYHEVTDYQTMLQILEEMK